MTRTSPWRRRRSSWRSTTATPSTSTKKKRSTPRSTSRTTPTDGGDYRVFENDDTDEIVARAKQESQAKGKEQQAQTDRKNTAKKNLDGIGTPTLGAGAKTSDEMLDQGNVTVDFLVQWTDEIWNKIKGGSGHIDSQKDLKDKFHENRGIQFQKFLTEADDLSKAHKVVEDSLSKSDTELQTLFGEWKGKGANAAEIKYDETIKPHAKELSQQIDGAAKLIPETVTHVYDAVKKKVDEVLELHRTTIAQADINMAKDVLKIANGETEEFDDFMKVAGWVDAVNAKNGNQTDLAERLQNDDCGFNDENKEYGRNVCRYWRDGAFGDRVPGPDQRLQRLLQVRQGHDRPAVRRARAVHGRLPQPADRGQERRQGDDNGGGKKDDGGGGKGRRRDRRGHRRRHRRGPVAAPAVAPRRRRRPGAARGRGPGEARGREEPDHRPAPRGRPGHRQAVPDRPDDR